MNDAFALLVGPTFKYVNEFLRTVERGENPPLVEVREELVALLGDAEQHAQSRALADDFALAKYALVYWIDELLIYSPWSHAEDWRRHILEWEFYHQNLGGELFFDKAREAETLPRTEALEVFFLCVALGFQGMYTHRLNDLQKWAERAYAKIASVSRTPERFLAEDPRDADLRPLRPQPGKSILLVVSLLASITALVTLGCFLVAVRWGD